MKPLNLATHPSLNERLPALLVTCLAILVMLATIAQAVTLYRLQNASSGGAQGLVAALEQELETLRSEADVGKAAVPAETRARWGLVKDMVDSRTLSWTDLFSRLEATLPPGVRLVSISPSVTKGLITLKITATARTPRDGRELVRLLEERGDFRDVSPLSEAPRDDGGAEFQYTMQYVPSVRPQPQPSPAASPAKPGSPDQASEDADDEAGT